jgi:hypothetical protein
VGGGGGSVCFFPHKLPQQYASSALFFSGENRQVAILFFSLAKKLVIFGVFHW